MTETEFDQLVILLRKLKKHLNTIGAPKTCTHAVTAVRVATVACAKHGWATNDGSS